MNLVDTHCHIYLDDFDTDREQIIENAKNSGIDILLLPNVDTDTIENLHTVCKSYPTVCFPMMGLHPTSVNKSYPDALKTIETYLYNEQVKYYGVGEIGIDLYWDKTHLKEQKIVFEKQLEWSIDLNLPVAIHTRDAFPEVFDSIHKIGPEKLKGVFHSFTGTEEELEEIRNFKNFKIGINGVVTFKNSRLSEVISGLSPDYILLETDAPYLAPVPFRGKRNEPAYMIKTAEKVAEIFNLPLEMIINVTRQNTFDLFKIKKS